MESAKLTEDLIDRTKNVLAKAKELQNLSESQLTKKASKDSWSAIECIEHLNLYGDFYLPEIKKQINNSIYPPAKTFKSSWLGNKFANSVAPRENLNSMKTFKDKNPVLLGSVRKNVISEFIRQQESMLNLLEASTQVNLNKVKTAISISKFIRLRLGDTFRVVIYHNQRHLEQAFKAIQ